MTALKNQLLYGFRIPLKYRWNGVVHYGHLLGGSWCHANSRCHDAPYLPTTEALTCLWCLAGMKA